MFVGSRSRFPTPASYGPPAVGVPDIAPARLVAYGTYLSNVGYCMLCHTPIGTDGKRDFGHRLVAGGFLVETAYGSRLSANITSGPKTGIGAWSDAEITAALAHGIAADGTALSIIMPWPYLEGMKPEDLRALVALLRSLPRSRTLLSSEDHVASLGRQSRRRLVNFE